LEATRTYIYDHFPMVMTAVSRYRWKLQGRQDRPSHGVKHRALQHYAMRFKLHTLIETGTFHGHMIASTKNLFSSIYSIELDAGNYYAARTRFAEYPHIHLIHGDSAQMLPRLLSEISSPCIFWLDAHYSGAGTARGDVSTPILSELGCILSHTITGHVVLIDDACDFNGTEDYPTIDEVRRFVAAYRPEARIEVKDNIIRIV
jgi:hypothetical protein